MVELDVLLQGFSANTSEGNLAYCGVTLVRGERLTLVDVGYPGRLAPLVASLKRRGIAPEQVERVVLTHAHWDHALNLLDFPNAEVVLSAAEHDYCANIHPADWATPKYVPDILRRSSRITLVRDGDELEPGLRVMAVPGHSPGSLAVLAKTADGVAGMVGDALPSRAAALAPVPSARIVFWDEEEAAKSARRIIDTCRFVYPGHDRPFRMESGSARYLQPTSLALVNPPRDEDGTLRAVVDASDVPFETLVQPSARRRG